MWGLLSCRTRSINGSGGHQKFSVTSGAITVWYKASSI
jgi:hypothetical protein